MNTQERTRVREQPGGAPPSGSSDFAAAPLGHVTVAHGIYSERLPLREMTVAEVRTQLADALDIHPEAVALLDAEHVGEDAIVRAGQRLVFVRRAGEKGCRRTGRSRAEKAAAQPIVLTIEDEWVVLRLPEGAEARMSVVEFLENVVGPIPDTHGVVLPEGIQVVVPTRNGFIAVHQTAPALHGLRWIAADSQCEFGPGTSYREVKLALPYLIVLAVFEKGRRGYFQLGDRNECFFAVRPISRQGMDTPLCFPALLNCSRFPDHPRHPLSWICTQHLPITERVPRKDIAVLTREGVRALLHHLLESGFNRSSEHHEVSSWFTATVDAAVDPRIASVETWEAASQADPLFALQVPWLPTGRTLGQVIERIRARTGGPAPWIQSSRDLAPILANRAQRMEKSDD